MKDFETQLEREFGLAPFTLRGELRGLDELLSLAKDAHAVAIAKFESLGDFRDLCDIADISPNSPTKTRQQQQKRQQVRQCSSDLEVLYADAKQAHTKLLSLFRSPEVASVDNGTGSTSGLSAPKFTAGEQGKAAAAVWVDKVIDPGAFLLRVLRIVEILIWFFLT